MLLLKWYQTMGKAFQACCLKRSGLGPTPFELYCRHRLENAFLALPGVWQALLCPSEPINDMCLNQIYKIHNIKSFIQAIHRDKLVKLKSSLIS